MKDSPDREETFDVVKLARAQTGLNKIITGEVTGLDARKHLLRVADNALAAASYVTEHSGFETDTGMFAGLSSLPEVPMLGFARTDGQALLYGGALSSITAEPGSGKSLVSTYASVEMARAGIGVLYLDFESTKSTMQTRLAQLGCGEDDAAAGHFHYVDMDSLGPALSSVSGFAAAITATLNATGSQVVVLDGLAVALSSLGLSENDNAEVSDMLRALINTLEQRDDRAFLVIDHISKPQENQSTKSKRYARGASAKLAMVALGLMVEVAQAPARGKPGILHWTIAKDRNGVLGPVGSRVATVRLNPVDRDGIEGGLDIVIDVPEGGQESGGLPLFLDGVAKSIMKVLKDGPKNKTQLRDGMKRGSWEKYGADTMAILVEFGFVEEQSGRGPARIYSKLQPLHDEDIAKIEADLQARKNGEPESPF